MRAVYLVCVDQSSTTEQRDAFTNHLRALNIGFWHQISHTWIITAQRGQTATSQIGHSLSIFMPDVPYIAIEVEPKDYATFSVPLGHQWLRDNLVVENGDQSEGSHHTALLEALKGAKVDGDD